MDLGLAFSTVNNKYSPEIRRLVYLVVKIAFPGIGTNVTPEIILAELICKIQIYGKG